MKGVFSRLLNPGKSCSGKFRLDFTDFLKLCRTGGMVGVSAALVYIMTNVGGVDFDGKENDTGVNVLIMAAITFTLDMINRCLKCNIEKEENKC